MADALPFEYMTRASQFVGIPDQMQAQLLDERDRDLEDYLARFAITPWVDVTFENSWVNFGSSEQDAQYRKAGDRVELRGEIKDGTDATVAFTLPVGFRPPANSEVLAYSRNAGADGAAHLAVSASTGAVTVFAPFTAKVVFYTSFSTTA